MAFYHCDEVEYGEQVTPSFKYDSIYTKHRVWKETDITVPNDLSNFDRDYVWSDGENIYYSKYTGSVNIQYKFDKQTHQWITQTWQGYSNISGDSIWSDGEDIYYSSSYNQYKLERGTNRWVSVGWKGASPRGSCIWTDGENIYYSYGSTQYILDISTRTWTTTELTGSTSLYGSDVYTDGFTIYANISQNPKKFDKDTHTWSTATWTGIPKSSSYDSPKPYPSSIWTDNKNVYVTQSSKHFILDRFTNTFYEVEWDGLYDFTATNVWSDGECIYAIYDNKCYELVSSVLQGFYFDISSDELKYKNVKLTPQLKYVWKPTTWDGLSNFDGNYIWTDGTDYYYSADSVQKVLDKDNHAWSDMTWTGVSSFYGNNVWTDGFDIYFSQGGINKILDRETHTWSDMNWVGLTDFFGTNVWTDGDKVYYSDKYSSIQKILDKETHTWSDMTWVNFTDLHGQLMWTDGYNIYFSDSVNSIQKVAEANGSTTNDNLTTTKWSNKIWGIGLTSFSGNYVWSDEDFIYCYSEGITYVLDIDNYTNEQWYKICSSPSVDTLSIWTDGDDYYYSDNGTNLKLVGASINCYCDLQ